MRKFARIPGGLELLEQAVLLFATSPPRAKFDYLLGAAPFGVALFYFWIAMSRSRAAADNLAIYAFVLALLFGMKSMTDSWYCRRLDAFLRAESGPKVNWAASLGAMSWQPLALPMIPVAFLMMIPFAWAMAFFRNVLLVPRRGAWRESLRHTQQNWILLAGLFFAGLLLFLNLLVLLILVPQLLRSFFGIESGLAQMGALALNWTTAGLVALVTYLALDPLISAAYVIRCFQGNARETGVDLRAMLRRVGILLIVGWPGWAADNAVDPRQFERTAAEVLRRDEFAWRLPAAATESPGWWQAIQREWERFAKWLGDLIERWFRRSPSTDSGDGTLGWLAQNSEWLLILLAIVFAVALGLLWIRRRRIPATITAAAPAAAVNIADEKVTADALPESGWLALAESLIAQGDFRLAVRALYLASVRYLSERRLVTIHFWKTGLDYRRELARRAKAMPAVEPMFASNHEVFERVWYGRDTADPEVVRGFAARLEEMKKHAEV